MTNTQAITLLVGILMPALISVLKQCGLNRYWNFLISVAACGIAGTLTVWARGELNLANVLQALATVFVASQAVYAAFWRDSGLETRIDVATSIVKGSCLAP
ncbi:MAG: hypothetical protein ACYC55_00305 [Candidatus Geothermincolia bacterium]